jgi:DNA polymerase-3 subunit epsilon
MDSEADLSAMIGTLEATGRFRVLRRLQLAEPGVARIDAPTKIGVVVDTETTGIDPTACKIIELAMRRIAFTAQGEIAKIGKPYSWREDPGEALDPVIAKLTGLTDADLAGQTIDTDIASELLRSSDVVIAHNAAFDRPCVERRLPGAAGLPWACSCYEIDWLERGFAGRALGALLTESGWFFGAHRAGGDVDAVIAMLQHVAPDGRTSLSELIENASQPGWLIRALGAHFDVRGELRAHGYRWDATEKTWRREVRAAERASEEAWLASAVYAPSRRPKASGPSTTPIDWRQRYAK